MHSLSARRGSLLLVVALLMISILLEQAIAAFFPLLGLAGGVRPMIVFLDIPLAAPVTIDWLPVGFIFLLFYGVVGAGRAEGRPPGEIHRPGWTILGRWWLLLILLLAGGALFGALSDFLPKTVRNGMDSFGVRADLILPYPSGETVHLHGSMLMLVCSWLGWRGLIRSVVRPFPPLATIPAARPQGATATILPPTPPPPSPVPVEANIRGRIAMRIPEPEEIRLPRSKPCVHVSMPRSVQRNNYPCIVQGGIRPSSDRPF